MLKFRILFSILMSLGLSILMTLWVTFINLGINDDFLLQWGKAFLLAWPVAAITAFMIAEPIRNLTQRLLS